MSAYKVVEASFIEAIECLNKGDVVYTLVNLKRYQVLEGWVRTQDLHTLPRELGSVTLKDYGIMLVHASTRFVREAKGVIREYRHGDDLDNIVDFDYGKPVAVHVCPKYGHTHVIYIHRATESLEHTLFHDSLKVRVYE